MVYTLRFFPLQNAVLFRNSNVFGSCIFKFYIQNLLKLKKNNSGSKRLNLVYTLRFFPLQNAVLFRNSNVFGSCIFTFYIQDVLKLKKNNSGSKRLNMVYTLRFFFLFRMQFCFVILTYLVPVFSHFIYRVC